MTPVNETDARHDARTVTQILRDLPPRERDEVLAGAVTSALAALPEADRAALKRMAGDLTDTVRGIGDRTALAVLGAIGMLWAGRS